MQPSFIDRVGFFFRKPEYIFQPVRMLKSRIGTSRDTTPAVRLPWGGEINVKSSDIIGKALIRHGVYELAVTEILWRLLRANDTFLDVGANIGYMSHLMASRAKGGIGMSFEPHPVVFSRLTANIEKFSERVKLFQCAVGHQGGRLQLVEPDSFGENEGTARLTRMGEACTGVEVDVVRLDDILSQDSTVRVMKIDVEGGELNVLLGATASLTNKRIEHIVYEDFHDFPSECGRLLQQFGYKVYRLTKGLWGPILWDPALPGAKNIDLPWEPTNYVATLNDEELLKLMMPRGWLSLRGRK